MLKFMQTKEKKEKESAKRKMVWYMKFIKVCAAIIWQSINKANQY